MEDWLECFSNGKIKVFRILEEFCDNSEMISVFTFLEQNISNQLDLFPSYESNANDSRSMFLNEQKDSNSIGWDTGIEWDGG